MNPHQNTPRFHISLTRLTLRSMIAGACCLFVVAAFVPNGHAFSIPFSTDFETDSIGSEPAGFAELKDTGFPDQSLNVIAAESSFVDGPGSAATGGLGSQALQWLDNNTTDSNPDILAFDLVPGTTDDLVFRFDFLNVTGNNLRFQVYDDAGTRAIRLDLDNGGTVKNNGGGAILEYTGNNKWLTLEITTDLASDTYDLVIQRDDRAAPLTFTGLPFNNAVSNFGSMQFNDLGGAGSTSEYYLDNVSAVVVIPEPTTSVFLLGGLGVLLLRRYKRR